MLQKFGAISVYVKDHDEAIQFYTESVGFVIKGDLSMGEMRWVTLAPSDSSETVMTLLLPQSPEQEALLDQLKEGPPVATLVTDDVDGDYTRMVEKGVHFFNEPTDKPYGRDCVFEDPCGNRFALLQPSTP